MKIKPAAIMSALVLGMHGLIHFLGSAVYVWRAEIEGLPYKTSFGNGALEFGQAGTGLYGCLWAAAGLGFLFAGALLLGGQPKARIAAAGSALFSLVLTGLDFQTAFAGAAINLAILGGVFLVPELVKPR